VSPEPVQEEKKDCGFMGWKCAGDVVGDVIDTVSDTVGDVVDKAQDVYADITDWSWVSWETVSTVGGIAAFGVCVFFSAGACAVAGAAAAVLSARFKAGDFTSTEFLDNFGRDLVFNVGGAALGWGVGAYRVSRTGLQISRRGTPTWYDRHMGWDRLAPGALGHASRLPWEGYAFGAGVGSAYCWVTSTCPSIPPWTLPPPAS
jgi:hypothetical protein